MSTVLKLAVHIHTEVSDDSTWSLHRLAKVLRRFGFHGMLVCDHDRTMDDVKWHSLRVACDEFGDNTGFLTIPGVEYQDRDHVVHVPVFGRLPFHGRSPDILSLIRSAREHGCVSVFAHPARRDAWQRFSPEWVEWLTGVEVWNRKYDGVSPNRWALEATDRHGLMPMVGLDWHGPRQLFGLAMEVSRPTMGTNAEMGDAVLASVLTGEARSTVFSLDVRRFSSGPLAVATRHIEAVRSWAAPRVRKFEAVTRRRP